MIEVLGVPEGLVHSVGILEAPGVFLARRRRRCERWLAFKSWMLFGLVARNDAECCKRELLGRSWRRDWAMRNFQEICTKYDRQKQIKQKILWILVHCLFVLLI